ncbi:TIGR04222 domain-containing membrane protein [Pseudonocardia xinjiangensis]
MALTATADTWGISGPTFLLAYLVIAVAVWVASTRARRVLAESRVTAPALDLTTRPHDIAYLNGGADLAVVSALSAMHLRGTVSSWHGAVRAAGRLEPGADELERAIHATARGGQRKRLPFHRQVAAALAAIDARLVTAGLLLSPQRRLRIRQMGLWMLAVAVLGLVRVVAGVAEAKPVGFLVAALVAVTVVATVQLSRAPRRTRLGDRTLAALRDEHHLLSPKVKPNWAIQGPAGAALSVGIFGMSALWASDPSFATELAAQRATTGGGTADGGAGGSGGGDGGGDGGGGGGCGGGCGG